MELSEETFHEIHRYLGGEGTPEERTAFEQRMQADEALAMEVATQRRIRNGLRANEYKNLFKDIHAQLQDEGALPVIGGKNNDEHGKIIPFIPENRSASRWPYFAAAVSILVAAGLIWYFNSQPKESPIASDVPVPAKPTARDTASQVRPAVKPDTLKTTRPKQKKPQTPRADLDKTDFFAAYFDEKVELESPFSKEKPGLSPSAFRQWQSDTAHVHQGVRYLAARDGEQALRELKQVETSRFPQVKSAADWYIALAYLQRNDLENCVEQLKKVAANPDNTNSKRAAELLAKIQ